VKFWLVKSPPQRITWEKFVERGFYRLSGIRNRQARNHLSAMQVDDQVLYYQSQFEPSVKGIARVRSNPYPDPSSSDPQWVAIDFEPVIALERAVSLAEIKSTSDLSEIPLVRQPRLSVMALTKRQFDSIVAIGASRVNI
jgi:predicted RNA-binding protein with PUA-like domain